MKDPYASCFLFAALLCGCTGCHNMQPTSVAESKEKGHAIIDALNDYKSQHGSYPEELSTLVPEFVESIEGPTAGTKKWIYHLFNNGDVFQLSFEGPYEHSPVCFWNSSSGKWSLDTR
jgi:hypothetical protein